MEQTLNQAAYQLPETEFHYTHKHKINFDRAYPILTLILLFFAFSFVGWVWEVGLHVVTEGVLINRGTMFGPWLPIYGAGGVVVLMLLRPFYKNPFLTFFLSMVVCGIIEYSASWYLEKAHGIRWWDYSQYPFNINGRICLEGLIIFGLGCCAVIYFAGPLLAALIDKMPRSNQFLLAAVLVGLFTADAIHSHFQPNTGRGITDYDNWQNNATPKAEAWLNRNIAPKLLSHLYKPR